MLTGVNFFSLFCRLVDEKLAKMSPSAWVLLCVILRHTLGFRKLFDAISLNQLCGGIIKRDGKRFSFGTGLSRNTVISAQTELVKLGLIEVTRGITPAGDAAINIYKLTTWYQPFVQVSEGRPPIGVAVPVAEVVQNLNHGVVQNSRPQVPDDQQVQQTSSSTPVSIDDDDVLPQSAETTKVVEEQPIPQHEQPEPAPATPSSPELVEQLVRSPFGMAKPRAAYLTTSYEPQAIRSWVDYIAAHVEIKNPAGYLTRMLEQGMPVPGPVRRGVATRPHRPELMQAVAQMSVAPPAPETPDDSLAALDAAALDEIRLQARRQVARMLNRTLDAVRDDCPLVGGVMLDLARQRAVAA